MRDSIDNLATMICSLLPPDSVTYASISAYETELNLDREAFLALTATSSLSHLNASPGMFRYKKSFSLFWVEMQMPLADKAAVARQVARTSLLSLLTISLESLTMLMLLLLSLIPRLSAAIDPAPFWMLHHPTRQQQQPLLVIVKRSLTTILTMQKSVSSMPK